MRARHPPILVLPRCGDNRSLIAIPTALNIKRSLGSSGIRKVVSRQMSSCRIGRSRGLRRELHAADEILKPGIGTQAIE